MTQNREGQGKNPQRAIRYISRVIRLKPSFGYPIGMPNFLSTIIPVLASPAVQSLQVSLGDNPFFFSRHRVLQRDGSRFSCRETANHALSQPNSLPFAFSILNIIWKLIRNIMEIIMNFMVTLLYKYTIISYTYMKLTNNLTYEI